MSVLPEVIQRKLFLDVDNLSIYENELSKLSNTNQNIFVSWLAIIDGFISPTS